MAARKESKSHAAYVRRNERARALGYKSYYDYRVHNHGRSKPSAARPSGESLARLRGHRSAADLRASVGEGTVVMVLDYERGKDGKFRWVDFQTVDVDGRERVFRLRGRQLRTSELRKLVADVGGAGGVISFSRYFDGLFPDEDAPDVQDLVAA